MKKFLGFLAVAGLMFAAMPAQQANASSLTSPLGVATAGHVSESGSMTTEVHYRGHRHWNRGHHRGWYRGHHRGWRHGYRHRHHHRYW